MFVWTAAGVCMKMKANGIHIMKRCIPSARSPLMKDRTCTKAFDTASRGISLMVVNARYPNGRQMDMKSGSGKEQVIQVGTIYHSLTELILILVGHLATVHSAVSQHQHRLHLRRYFSYLLVVRQPSSPPDQTLLPLRWQDPGLATPLSVQQ